MLWYAATSCAAFASILADTAQRFPPSVTHPWRFIFYADEVIPGNPMKGWNKRKVYAMYFSILEFGMELLSREAVWFCIFAVRTSELRGLDGGISYVFAQAFNLFFWSTETLCQ